MTPTVVGERLFAGSCSGSFFAFDRKRGGVLWLYDTSTDGPPANFHGEPLITDELIVVGSDVDWVLFPESGTERVEYVYAFEQSSGKVRWKHGATAGVISEIVRRGETVYGVTKDGELLALALADGRLRFRIRTGDGSADASIRYSALVHNDRVIFTGAGNSVVAVNADDGEQVWIRSLETKINTTLVHSAGSLFVGTLGRAIYRLDESTGEVTARYETDGFPYGTPVVLDKSLLALVGGKSFVRLGTDPPRVIWEQTTSTEWTSFRPVKLGDRVLVGDEEGELLALDAESGSVSGRWLFAGGIRGFSIVDGVLYVSALGGKLYAYSTCDGAGRSICLRSADDSHGKGGQF